jgi:hypothetical protein
MVGYDPTLTLFLVGISEDFEDLVYQLLAPLGREIPRVNGLFIGLEVAELAFLGQVPVYKTHHSIDLLAREAVAATG